MANATYIKETTDLKTAATAAYVTAGRPSRPEESGLGQRRGSEPGTGVYPRKKMQAPQMPGHLTDLIVDYIVQNATNVTELFHAWDKNHDGLIDKVEFRTFLNGVGFIVPREASDAMFDTFDDDGSGGLDYSELVRKSRKLAFERGKNMKDKPKTGNPSLSRFNEKWTEKNIAHQKAFAKSVQKRNLQQAARAEAEVAVRRVAQLEARRERRDEARVRGTEAKEPYRLRQMKDDRCAASASPRPAIRCTPHLCLAAHALLTPSAGGTRTRSDCGRRRRRKTCSLPTRGSTRACSCPSPASRCAAAKLRSAHRSTHASGPTHGKRRCARCTPCPVTRTRWTPIRRVNISREAFSYVPHVVSAGSPPRPLVGG